MSKRRSPDLGADSGMGDIGQVLSVARRGAGISIEEAAWSTRLRADYLDALERNDVEGLGLDPAYVRGTLRTYADYLGLDSEALVRRHGAGTAGVGQGRRARRRMPLALVAVAGVIVLAVVGFTIGSMTAGWQTPWTLARAETAAGDDAAEGDGLAAAGGSEVAGTDTAGTSATEDAAGSEAATDVADGATEAASEQEFLVATSDEPLTLKLKVTGYVWMRVVVDGETALEGLYDDGFAERFTADESIDLRLGVGGNVEFTINGVWYGPLGQGTNGPLNLRCDRADGCYRLQDDG